MKVCSMFSQLLQLVPRGETEQLARQLGVTHGLKGFGVWDHLVSLLFCQLAQAHSLREIHGGLASCAGKLNHLGLRHAPRVSTLSYANRHRASELFEELFYSLLRRFQGESLGRHKFRFKNKLISLDATTVDLCLSMYDWATFRRTKGAIKLHLQLDHDGHLPCFAVVSDGRTADIEVARTMSFDRGTIVVFDRGYNDYDWFDRLTREGVFFVTRLKSNAVYSVEQSYEPPSRGHVLSDEDIVLDSDQGRYRHIRVRVPDASQRQGRGPEVVLDFLTNNTALSAATIAEIYTQRWQIEIFFKALKQHLKIKTFLGTNREAVLSQIWTALIAMLLIKYLLHRSRHNWSLSNLIALLRMNMFVHRSLWQWLDNPQVPPPELVDTGQGVLQLR